MSRERTQGAVVARHAARPTPVDRTRSVSGLLALTVLAASAVTQIASFTSARRTLALTDVASTRAIPSVPSIPVDDWGGALVKEQPIDARGQVSAPAVQQVATSSPGSIPTLTLAIYQRAADNSRAEAPGCHLRWPLLAAIGLIESNHGRHTELLNGRQVVLGPVLDGRGFAAVPDTDGGRLDGNSQWDRAVGPMQFLPGTWAQYGRDANGDGTADPQDGADAAAATARYLCANGGDLATVAGLRSGVFAYNHSTAYVQHVLSFMVGYSDSPALTALGRQAIPA